MSDIMSQNQIKVAKATLALAQPYDMVLGVGHATARKIMKEVAGWSDKRIAEYESSLQKKSYGVKNAVESI